MTSMTRVPSVLLHQLRTTLPHDSDATFFLSDIIAAARAVVDAAPLTEGGPDYSNLAEKFCEGIPGVTDEMVSDFQAKIDATSEAMRNDISTPGTVILARPIGKKGSRVYRPMIRIRRSAARLHPKRVWMDEAGRFYTFVQLDVQEVVRYG